MDRFELNIDASRAAIETQLIENRRTHREIFEKAIERYRAAAIQLLNERIDDIKRGKTLQTIVSLPIPEDHTADYDRAIKMVEMHLGETITLTETTYRCFYDDDWDWKDRWVGTTQSYVT